MANLRVFVSSTCFDLSVVRSQLRLFLEHQGHLPVMSDYNDVLYDPRVHTHTSCVDEVAGCDMVVLIIGGRFGGKALPQASSQIDFEKLQEETKNVAFLKNTKDISVTQLEALKAIDRSIPVCVFVEERVWHDHATYEKNKTKNISAEIEYASIEKSSTAKYIFEFVNYLRHRTNGNSVTPFARYQDIEEALRKQWSGLLQRLLFEQRTKVMETRRIDDLTEQFEDLKAAILSGVSGKNERLIARGVVRFRNLYEFLSDVNATDKAPTSLYTGPAMSWPDFLAKFEIEKVVELPRELTRDLANVGPRLTGAFIKTDGTFYATYFPLKAGEIEAEFISFMELTANNRKIIFETLEETRSRMRGRYTRYIGKGLEEFLTERQAVRQVELLTPELRSSEVVDVVASRITEQLRQEVRALNNVVFPIDLSASIEQPLQKAVGAVKRTSKPMAVKGVQKKTVRKVATVTKPKKSVVKKK